MLFENLEFNLEVVFKGRICENLYVFYAHNNSHALGNVPGFVVQIFAVRTFLFFGDGGDRLEELLLVHFELRSPVDAAAGASITALERLRKQF